MKTRTLLLAAALFLAWTLGLRIVFAPPEAVEVVLEMTSGTPGQVQLFVDDGGGFRESLSARTELVGDARVRRQRLGVETARVEALRLDPLNRPGTVTLHAVTVDFGGRIRRYRGAALASWQAAHQLEATSSAEGLVLRSTGNDPWLVLAEAWPAPPRWRRYLRRPAWQELCLVPLAVPLLVLGLGAPSRRILVHGLALAAPLGVVAALNAEALGGFWTHDDPCLLDAALSGGLLAHFYSPEVWRALSGSVLMPWTTLSLGVDAHIFGLVPRAFYVHHLAALAVLIGVAYALLRRSFSAFSASVALVVFAGSAPSYAVAQQLMNRHYLEGLVLALLALGLYLRAVRTDRTLPAVGGAFLYLLATTAKEIYVPLVLLLPFTAPGTWRERLRAMAPFAAVAFFYVPWRLYMLGWRNVLSGYGGRGQGFDLADAFALPAMLGLGGTWRLAAVAVVAVLAVVALARGSRAKLAAGAVTAALLVLPLVPVAGFLGPRHFFVPALAAAFLMAGLLERSSPAPGRTAAAGLALVLLGLSALCASPFWRRHAAIAEHYRAEGEFVLTSQEEGVLYTTLSDTNYLSCMARLRRGSSMARLRRDAGPGFCGDPCWCVTELGEHDAWRYVEGEIVAFQPAVAACAETRELRVEMSYDPRTARLAWHLGPWETGRYELLLLSADGTEVTIPTPLARAGEAPLQILEPWGAVVKYRSPEGWQTYSPVLTLDPAVGRLSWRR